MTTPPPTASASTGPAPQANASQPRASQAPADLAPLVGRAFWVALVAVVTVGVLAAGLVLAQYRAARWANHSRDVARVGRQALQLSVDHELALRVSAATADDTAALVARLARDGQPAKLDSLVAMTGDNAAQQDRARALREAVRAWDASAARAGDVAGSLHRFNVVRARAQDFLDVEDALFEERRERASLARVFVFITIVGGLGVVATMLVRLRAELVAQARALDEKQHQLEEQAVELEAQTAELEMLNEEARETNERLLTAVSETTRVNEELEAFSYTMAHDLRAPLRALDGYGYMLEQDFADRLDDTGRDHLAKLRGGSRRMARLIDDLLSLAKVGRGGLRRERVDLSAAARAALEDLRRAEPARRVVADVEPGMHAMGDPVLLSLVMQNLVGNAWKFSAIRDEAHLTVGIDRSGSEVTYFVRDDGAGFDMAYADKLFGAFQRLHGPEFEGTGIGLAIVQRIVTRHGGRVWAESAPGRGATFHFTIPRAEQVAR